jgi:hypothetical protein
MVMAVHVSGLPAVEPAEFVELILYACANQPLCRSPGAVGLPRLSKEIDHLRLTAQRLLGGSGRGVSHGQIEVKPDREVM